MAEENIEEGHRKSDWNRKSAILMMLLGEDEAAQVLQNLTPREVQHLGTAMYSVTGVDQNTVNAVLDEFLKQLKSKLASGLAQVNILKMFLQKHWEMTRRSLFWS